MWPSRFTRPSSPPSYDSRSTSPRSRDYRRSSHAGQKANDQPKVQFSPRSSSLNVSNSLNESTFSLSSSRYVPGSGFRKEISATPDIRDPLAVLEGIVGETPFELRAEEQESINERPTLLMDEIDFRGFSLSEFFFWNGAHDSEISKTNGACMSAEEFSWKIIISFLADERDKGRFEDLHRSVSACDRVLRSVEVSLTQFQTELGAVSAEIETLQNRSTTLNTKLENRKIVERLLGPTLENITISPAVVRRLTQDPIDSDWVAALEILEQRSFTISRRLKESDQILAASDLLPLMGDLTNRAIEQIRDFFVSQIKVLRSPNNNAQNIQQRAFLAYKNLFVFISKYHPQLGEEIIQAYSNTMRWYYLSNFTRYMQTLGKVPLYVVEKSDALGNDQLSQKGPIASSPNLHKSPNPLSLDRRSEILTRSAHSGIPSPLIVQTKSPAHMETLFHAFSTAVTDNVTAEYSFLASFISASPSSPSLSRVFAGIFTSTFDLAHSFTRQLIDNNYDCLGLLLCVRVIQHHAFSLQRKKCPVAESWINGTNMMLWPRFQVAMDVHVDSIKKATNTISLGSRATLSLTSNKAISNKESTAPHPFTQRFSHFLEGILALCSTDASAYISGGSSNVQAVSTGSDIEPVSRSVERLRNEFDSFLIKTAKGINPGRRERFLGNNYSLILTIVGDMNGRLAKEQRAWFAERKDGVGEA